MGNAEYMGLFLKRHLHQSEMLLLVALLSASSLSEASVLGYPLHASCELTWTFSESCETVKSKIVEQITAWDTEVCPMTSPGCTKLPCGQMCLYKLTGSEDTSVTGTHTTPVARYVDALTFNFSDDGTGCSVEAKSRAETLLAWLDFGTNYCNLRNLIDGAGLSGTDGFTEETSTSVCTQVDTADCSRY